MLSLPSLILRLMLPLALSLAMPAGPSAAGVFGDDFDRASLGPDWQIDDGSFSIVSNELVEDSATKQIDSQLRYVAGTTSGADQFAKLQLVQQNGHTWGFMFRVGDASGFHYEVHLPAGGSAWRWETYDPAFVRREDDCFGDQIPVDGDWIGAQVEGTGSDTLVSVWRWDADPGPDPLADWGPPDCQMTQDPVAPSPDTGTGLGIRAFTGNSQGLAAADHWSAGDAPGPIPPPPPPPDSGISVILDATGGGTGTPLRDPDGLALDSQGNLYVAACGTNPDNQGLYKVTPSNEVSLLIDSMGDGVNFADCFVGVDVDSQDNVYVATLSTNRVFRVTPAGAVSMVLDPAGAGGPLDGVLDVAVDPADNLFVGAINSDAVYRVTPMGAVSLVLDASGDGVTPLDAPFGLATDSLGNLYVAGIGPGSDAVFKVEPGGAVSVVLDASGDGQGNVLIAPHSLAVDDLDDLYVTGNGSDNVFRVSSLGVVTELADLSGDGIHPMDNPTGIDVDADGIVYVSSFNSDNVFEIDPGVSTTQILDASGDGNQAFDAPSDFGVCVDDVSGAVYAAGTGSDNVFRILPEPGTPAALSLAVALLAALRRRRSARGG